MLDNLNSNFESSKAQRPDANDDEVEIDLLEIFYALKKKILLVLMVALAGGCIAAAYTQFLMTPFTAPHPVSLYFRRNHTDITGGSAVRCQPDQ